MYLYLLYVVLAVTYIFKMQFDAPSSVFELAEPVKADEIEVLIINFVPLCYMDGMVYWRKMLI